MARYEIRLSGEGGQGLVTAGAILAAVKPAQAAKLTELLIGHRRKNEK